MHAFKTPEMDIEFITLQRLMFKPYTFPELKEILDNAGFRDTENALTDVIEQLFKDKKIAFTNYSRNGHKAYKLANKEY